MYKRQQLKGKDETSRPLKLGLILLVALVPILLIIKQPDYGTALAFIMSLIFNRLTKLDSHLHQLADTVLIQLSERIILEDLGVIVSVQELTCIITGEAEGHLGQIVG